MEIRVLEKKVILEKTIDVIKETYIECDKCQIKVSSECQISLEEDTCFMQLCDNCTKDFLQLLKSNGYRTIGYNNYRVENVT